MRVNVISMFLLTACAVDTDETASATFESTSDCCDKECCDKECCDKECCDKECPPPVSECPVELLDAAPANVDNSDGKVTFCHATSSATNPFVIITTSVNACFAHEQHTHLPKGGEEDVFPTGGCAD
jgi:hypothetical protein